MAGFVAVVLAWAFKTNTNLLYVFYLLCSYVILQLLVTRLSLRVGLFVVFLVFLFVSPKPRFPEQRTFFSGPSASKILAAGATRSYRFMLAPLRERQAECGSLQRADIYVHGKHVDGPDRAPVLSVDQGTVSDQKLSPFYAYVMLSGRADFAAGLPDEVRVGLHNPGQNPFAIYLGPESADARVYPEAVFMKFETPACHIVVHSNPVD